MEHSYPVPIFKNKKVTVAQDDNFITIAYATNDIQDGVIIENPIGLTYNPYDFRENTKLHNKEWRVINGVNVYSNSNLSSNEQIVMGNMTGFEKIQLIIIKK